MEEEEEEEEKEEVTLCLTPHQKQPSKAKRTKGAKHPKVEHKRPPRGRKPKTTKVDQRKQQSEDGATGEKDVGHHGVVSFPDQPPSSATTDESDMETSAIGMGEAKEGDVGGELPMEGCWRHFSDLCELLPGRRPQIELLLTLFGEVSVHI